MARHLKAPDPYDEPAGPGPDPDDTSRQWAPMSDEEWAAQDAGFFAETSAAPGTQPASQSLPPYVEPYDPSAYVAGSAGAAASSPGATAVRPAAANARARGSARSAQASTVASAAPADAPREHHHARARHGCLSLLLWLVMAAVVALMLARTLSADEALVSALPELVSFVPLLFVPIIACLVLALLWHRRLLALVCAACLAVCGYWHLGYFVPTAQVSDEAAAAVAASATTEDSAARIMTLNVSNGEASAAEIVALVAEQNVEVLCLQELTDDFVVELEEAGLSELLPYHVISDGASEISNGGRNGIWTLAAQSNVSTNLLTIQTSSMPAVDISIGGQTLRIVCVHPNSPVKGAEDVWDAGLTVIGTLSDYDHSYVIMGDFNSTWDHARFRELLGTTFVDAGEQSGEGYHFTYPANNVVPPLIEIDHIVYDNSSGVVVSDLQTVEISGTDHLALLGTLEVQ